MEKYFICLILLFSIFIANCKKDEFEIDYNITIYGNVIESKSKNPISNVVVSDGYNTTLTSADGRFILNASEKARYIYCVVPENYEVNTSHEKYRFYKQINAVNDTCSVNFELTLLSNGVEKEFTLLLLADVHIRDDISFRRFLNETVVDIKKEIKQHTNIYGINLGDLVSDKTEYFPALQETFINIDIPFLHVIGNHDFMPEENETIKAAFDFENHFGPKNYSLNRGNTHIVVINSNIYAGDAMHSRGFTREQMSWLKKNLKYVDKNKTLLVFTHIPPRFNEYRLKEEFFNIIEGFKEVHIFGGHSHRNEFVIHEDYNIYDHTISNASGNAWIRGIMNRHGAPNGYSIYKINGNTITDGYHKPVNYPKDFQIRMYEPFSFGDEDGYVVANIWNYDERWLVKMYEDGVPLGYMENFTDYDPGTFEYIMSIGRTPDKQPAWFRTTTKLFRLKPNNPDSHICVVAIDPYGNVFQQENFTTSLDEFDTY